MKPTKTSLAAWCFWLAFAGTAHAQPVTTASAPADECTSSQISVTTDGSVGDFNGMSHSGTLLVVRNTSSLACRLAVLPAVTLESNSGEPLQVAVVPASNPFRGPMVNGKPIPMGHGPVALPIELRAGDSVSSTLRWVSGSVYEHSVCVDVASVSVATAGGNADGRLSAHICGPDADHVQLTATRFAPESGGRP